MPHLRRSQPGFSLIELLVVIAIISILAGLLFPAFVSAKKAAKAIKTVINLRQMGMAVSMYAESNDDRLPGATDGLQGQGMAGGWVYYDKFGQPGETAHFDVSLGSLYPYVSNRDIYKSDNAPDGNASGLSFAINGCLIEPPYKSTGLNALKTMSAVDNPSGIMLLGEEGTLSSNYPWADYTSGTDDGFFNPLYNHFSEWQPGGSAVLYPDSHAKVFHARKRFDDTLYGQGNTSCW